MATPGQIVATLTDEYTSADSFVNKARESIAQRALTLRAEYLSGYALRLARTEWLAAALNGNHKPEPGIGEIIKPEFDGVTYEPEHDKKRLTNLAKKVKTLMLDGRWRTLGEIKAVTGGGEASISARLRDLRKQKHGGWAVDRRRRGDAAQGIHEYRLCKTNEVW